MQKEGKHDSMRSPFVARKLISVMICDPVWSKSEGSMNIFIHAWPNGTDTENWVRLPKLLDPTEVFFNL